VLPFEERAAAVVAETGELTLEGPSGRHTVTHEVVIGADGAYSALREAVVRSERADYRQEHLPWGYKELTIAPDASGGFALDPAALHIWPRGASMMIALPNPDRSFTATLFWPFEGDAGFAGLDTPDAVRARFDRDYLTPPNGSRTWPASSPGTRWARSSPCGSGLGSGGGWACSATRPTPSSRSSGRA
jgi:kynurenine 3-monooxygenase